MRYRKGGTLVSGSIWFRCASFLTFYSVIGIALALLYGMSRHRVHNRFRLRGLKRAVTVSNHTLFLDPVLMSAAVLPGRMFQTLLEETVCSPFVGTFTRLLGGMPVPGGDTHMARLREGAEDALSQRRFLHFYPEGECYLYSSRPGRFHVGAFAVAAMLGVPVVPMATVFRKGGSRRPRAHLYILEPMYPQDFGVLSADGAVDIRAARRFAEAARGRIREEIERRGGTGEYCRGHLGRIPGING